LLQGIADIAAELPAALEGSDWRAVGGLVAREWRLRRQLAEGVSVPAVERLLDAASAAGAWGGKACGAGGGGCVAILAPADRRDDVIAAVVAAGGVIVEARPTASALELSAH
jgi:D-glycero-alpha-D-manno-heptose-7-phosphate kinase